MADRVFIHGRWRRLHSARSCCNQFCESRTGISSDARDKHNARSNSNTDCELVEDVAHTLGEGQEEGREEERLHLLWTTNTPQRTPSTAMRGASAMSPGPQDVNLQDSVINFKLVLSYDGTRYKGFQLQRNSSCVTVQCRLEHALGKITQEPREDLKVTCSGRTDSGVHALRQVVNFHTFKRHLTAGMLYRALNSMLPYDIRVVEVAQVPVDFHSRYTAIAKEYHFWLHTEDVLPPWWYNYRMHARYHLDVDAMRNASQLFVGQHDFTQFANVVPHKVNPVKCIHHFNMKEVEGGIKMEIKGSGFLYRQVRHMVGALLAVAQGRLQESVIAQRLEIGASVEIGNAWRGWSAADAKGLFLAEVWYPPHDRLDLVLHPNLQHDQYGRLKAAL